MFIFLGLSQSGLYYSSCFLCWRNKFKLNMTVYETASYDYDAKISIPVEPSRQSTRKNQKRICIETSRSK